MKRIITYHLSDSDLIDPLDQKVLRFGTYELAFPSPDANWIGDLALQLRQAGEALAERGMEEVLHSLGSLNARWAEPFSPERQEADALLSIVTGYPAAVIGPALTHLFGGLRAPQLEAGLTEELGDQRALDSWVERLVLGRRSRAFGPGLTVVVASGNVPMAALPSIVYTLAMKSPVLVKLSSEEPVLAGLYLRSLSKWDESLGRAAAAVWWPGGDEAIEASVLAQADAVIAFGGESALQSLRSRLAPETRFQPHGHRVGFGMVGRERLARPRLATLAHAAARDVAEFDQQGCVAPHRLFIERGGQIEAREFGAALAEALASKATEWPRTPPPAGTSAAIHQLRAAAEVRTAVHPEAALFASPGSTDWTVIVDPEPGFAPGCLYRTVILHPIDDLEAVPQIVAPLSPYLQTVAAALSPERLTALALSLARIGVTRLCPLGHTQHPSPGWRPDGRPRIAELVRWLDWEIEPDEHEDTSRRTQRRKGRPPAARVPGSAKVDEGKGPDPVSSFLP